MRNGGLLPLMPRSLLSFESSLDVYLRILNLSDRWIFLTKLGYHCFNNEESAMLKCFGCCHQGQGYELSSCPHKITVCHDLWAFETFLPQNWYAGVLLPARRTVEVFDVVYKFNVLRWDPLKSGSEQLDLSSTTLGYRYPEYWVMLFHWHVACEWARR